MFGCKLSLKRIFYTLCVYYKCIHVIKVRVPSVMTPPKGIYSGPGACDAVGKLSPGDEA